MANLTKICNTSKSKIPPKNTASLDTLAQLVTTGENDAEFDLQSCTTISDKKTLIKRARRKYFTTGLVTSLVDAAKLNPNSILEKSYWRSYHCCSELSVMSDNKVVSDYCKCRWCMVCNAIRTANHINKYSPILDSWFDSHLLTLTIPNCKGESLRNTINLMQANFLKIRKLCNQYSKRGKIDFKLCGIRKLECTYNSFRRDFHPHYHVILKSKEMGDFFLSHWMRLNPECVIQAQDLRKADLGASKELFKYMTKVIASGGKSKGKKADRRIYAAPLDVIFNAMHRKRVIQPFGFTLEKNIDENAPVSCDVLVSMMKWQQCITDWVDCYTGETLTNYTPSDGMRDLVENKIFV